MKTSKNFLLAALTGLLGAGLFLFGIIYTGTHYLDPHATINVDYFLIPGVLLLISVPIILKKVVLSAVFIAVGMLFFLWVYSDIFQ